MEGAAREEAHSEAVAALVAAHSEVGAARVAAPSVADAALVAVHLEEATVVDRLEAADNDRR